jgi:hypothetical protein
MSNRALRDAITGRGRRHRREREPPMEHARHGRRARGSINAPVSRPTSWWLAALRRRAETMLEDEPTFDEPVEFADEAERAACIAFFNAALRAEESGHAQAHALADEVRRWDADLAETLRLYGDEEGWHRGLILKLLESIGGDVRPMGNITSTFYATYARAKEMETIMLTNLMFETIGSTTYRIALGRVRQPILRRMLTILARDESFHVPLNVHFIREMLRHKGQAPLSRLKLKAVYHVVFAALLGSSYASRRVARRFDRISFRELSVAYAENLGRLFLDERDLDLQPPWALLRLVGLDRERLLAVDASATSVASAERAVDRHRVEVTAL